MSLTADLIAEPACAALFEPPALVQALLDVEAALALARADAGLQSCVPRWPAGPGRPWS